MTISNSSLSFHVYLNEKKFKGFRVKKSFLQRVQAFCFHAKVKCWSFKHYDKKNTDDHIGGSSRTLKHLSA